MVRAFLAYCIIKSSTHVQSNTLYIQKMYTRLTTIKQMNLSYFGCHISFSTTLCPVKKVNP